MQAIDYQIVTPPQESLKPQAVNKKRLEFIDLAKGICIILVVCFHGGAITWPPLLMLRMPLYFILSGLFYKDYGGLINLSIRKFDKLIIPFIFFVILTIISTNIIGLILPAFSVVEFNDLSFNRPIPTPVWFLLCLFWDNLIFWLIRKLSQSKAVQFILILMTSIIGVILITHEIFLPLHLTSSIISMPFFFAGTVIRTIPTLNNGNNSKKRDVTIFLLLTILVMIFAYSLNWPDINMYMCSATLTETLAYIPLSIIMVIGFLHLCKVVKSIPVVSYMGRYSIIILGIHNIILGLMINIMKGLCNTDSPCPGVFVTLAICLSAIPLCRLIVPHFTAQKEVLTPFINRIKSSTVPIG